MIEKIGFGGGCHWCTEAVFQSLKGVNKVEQGWIASNGVNEAFSEAIIVHFNTEIIDLESLVAIHLYTHSSSSNHALRNKYRSAVYCFNDAQISNVRTIIANLQESFNEPIITQVLLFSAFKENEERFQNYYLKHQESPFCKRFIHPKFKILIEKFGDKLSKKKSVT